MLGTSNLGSWNGRWNESQGSAEEVWEEELRIEEDKVDMEEEVQGEHEQV